jgi:F-type H+-transporting ATPase subunit a
VLENGIVQDSIAANVSTAAENLKEVIAQGASGHQEEFNFIHLLDHVKDSHEVEILSYRLELPHIPAVHLGNLTLDISPTKHVFFLLVSAVILVIAAIYAARVYRKHSVPHGFANLIEMLVLFVRDEIALPTMGEVGIRYVPYLLTTFFFILLMNLMGLVPYGATATGNVMVTAGLASVAFIMIQISAIRAQGLKSYFMHLTGGVHWGLWIIMIPVEIVGMFTKPFALCIRLFANMNAGHIVILSLIGLIFMFRTFAVAPVSIGLAVFISMLEIFVAVLQAYIFTMLTSLFMGFGIQAAHEEH